MSPVPEDAICSYGWPGCIHLPDDTPDAVAWIEQVERKRLRWWQRLATVRQLEHREDGSLCHRNVLDSAPRRAGKSVRLRGIALWRMEFGWRLFGEVQTVMHTGSDVAICREIQRGAWRWAEDVAGWKVSTANGKEAIESLADDRWLVRSQTAVYGYDVTLGLGDECWDVDPGTISEGLEPAMLERQSPQLHLTSTAHRRATSLMRGRLATALTTADDTLVLVWAAVAGSDPADPATWRAASPHWTEDRRKMIAAKYHAAEAGQVDPQADDPDPMAGFTAQYLNIWRLTARPEAKGSALVSDDDWGDLMALVEVDRQPDAAAIESHFSAGVSLALAWREGDTVTVTASGHRDVADAVAAMRRSAFRGKPVVGASLAEDPALKRVPCKPSKGRAGAAVDYLARLLKQGALHHAGDPHLTGQVLEVRTMPSSDGARVTSRGRADAVKAVAWAAEAARTKPTGSVRIILPPRG